MTACPCGTQKNYSDCCGAFIDNVRLPQTPEELMRSRYTAYANANIDYIQRTMKGPALTRFHPENAKQWAEAVEWLQLKVVASAVDGPKGTVEFLAYFKENNKKFVMHELSEFLQEEGQWYYVDGSNPKHKPHQHMPEVRLNRNDPCYCGSSKKYKKCCGENL